MATELASDQHQPEQEPTLVTEADNTATTDVTTGNECVEEGKDEENEEGEEGEGEEDPKAIYLHNLCILPPLQKDPKENFNDNVITKDTVLLPSIGPNEPVSAIRGALAEIRGYAHITNYRLVIEDIDEEVHQSIVENSKARAKETLVVATSSKLAGGKSSGATNGSSAAGGGGGKKKKKKASSNNGYSHSSTSVPVQDVVSPYTSNRAVIKVSSSILSLDSDGVQQHTNNDEGKDEEITLNDFGDLSTYVESNDLDSNMGLRMVLERYDVGLVKEHVMKTRFLLDGNAPCVLRVIGDNGDEVDGEAGNEASQGNEDSEGSTVSFSV